MKMPWYVSFRKMGPVRSLILLSVTSRRHVQIRFAHKLYDLYYNVSDSSGSSSSGFSVLSDGLPERIVADLKACGRGLFIVDAAAMIRHFDVMETALEDSIAYIHDGT